MVMMEKKGTWSFAKPALVAAAIACLASGCQNEQRTQELVQMRLDAEKVKELSGEVAELKKTNESLKQENDSLKAQLHQAQQTAQTKEVPQTKVALTPKPKNKTNGDAPSKPKQPEALPESAIELKKAATGGSSFK